MASRLALSANVAQAANAAVAGLVRVRDGWGDAAYVNLPMIYPSGSFVTVRVTPTPGGFRVDDVGFAYREIESVGADRRFRKAAPKIGVAHDVEHNRRMFFTEASAQELGRAICDVAAASWKLADQVFARLSDSDEAEVEDYLRERLLKIFGTETVSSEHIVVGSSSNEWDVSAVIRFEGNVTVFQAVGAHANSIYRTSTAFHDLAELPHPPRLVAVVKDREALGHKLAILSQAGRVIESGQPDDAYLRAAA